MYKNKRNFIVLILSLIIIYSCNEQRLWVKSEPTIVPASTPKATPPIPAVDCSSINPEKLIGQASYRGIFPGKTLPNEVKEILGAPESVFFSNDNLQVFEYPKLDVSIKDQKVYLVDDNARKPRLFDVIKEFGCPGVIIIAQDIYQSLVTDFIYYKNGVTIRSFDNPVTLESILYLTYFEPTNTIEDFINLSLDHLDNKKIIPWNEAVFQ